MSKGKSIIRASGRGKVTFEKAPDEIVMDHEKEVSSILSILGHPEALVTDGTRLSDFPLDDRKLERIRRLSGVKFGSHALLVVVAEAARKSRSGKKASNGGKL